MSIVDNDVQQVEFDVAQQTVWEDAGAVSFRVRTNRVSDQDVTIPLTVSMQGLAQNDLQGAIPKNVVLSAGELQKTFTINLSDDTQNERQESFSVQLGRPTGGASLGQQFSQTVRVRDNDPKFSSTPNCEAWTKAIAASTS